MNVRELIALLEQQPPDAVVLSEGCDCYGVTAGVLMGPGCYASNTLLICRVDGHYSQQEKAPIATPLKSRKVSK